MRPDMSKVIVERPRLGGGTSRTGRVLDYDDLPSHEGMASPHRRHWRGKSLNENLSPLRRFLESRVGQYWPKVYAEICENLRPSSTVQQHVRNHLKDFVAVRTSIKDGVIWIHDGWRVHRLDDSWKQFFVHPVSACLMRNKHVTSVAKRFREHREHAAAETAKRRRDIGDGRQLHKLHGCWFEVTLATIEPRRNTFAKSHRSRIRLVIGPQRDDVVDAGLSDHEREKLYGRSDVFAVSKRQLSHRELRNYGLQND